MRNLKKSLSLILALALIVSSVFVGGITASAATELYTTLNTYDDTATYPLSNWTYNGSKTVHIGTYTEGAEETTYNNIGMEGVELVNDPLDSEKSNNVLHIIESKATNNAYPASVWVYKQNTNYSHFVPKANTTYEISLRYYVDAIPSQQINLQVRQHTDKRPYNATYKAEDVFVSDFVEITGVTNGWVDAVARFTTGETPSNLYIVSCTLTGSAASNISVYIDDVFVSECAAIKAYNYNGDTDGEIYATTTTTMAQCGAPEIEGYYLNGIFADAEHTIRVGASDLAIDYIDSGLYYDWRELQDGEYFCGFEKYTPAVEGSSYDKSVSDIISGNVYNGNYAMKTKLPANALTAIELRDKEAFEIKAGVEYEVSFSYKSTADAKIFAGIGKTSDLVNTAYAIKGADLPAAAGWTNASITFTADKGTTEGFSPALLLSSVAEAEILLDAIYLTYPAEKTSALTGITFSESTAWYPALALFEGEVITDEVIPEEEPIDYWDGSEVAPTDSDNDGVYEINTPENLAYVVKNGGTIYKTEVTIDPETNEEITTQVPVVENGSYILTNDIYLNDVTKYDWLSDAKASGLKSWYTTDSVSIGFNGTIDGNYHNIYGLYSKYAHSSWQSNNGGRGLIPKVNNGQTATIKNLNMDFAHVDAEVSAGLFVGHVYGGTAVIDSCTAGENVFITGYRACVFVSGGYEGAKYTVSNCSSFAKTEIENLASGENLNNACHGLVSSYYITKGTIENSFNANGPIVDTSNSAVTAKNCYATVAGGEDATILTAEQMQGSEVLENTGTMINLNTKGNYWTATAKYPVLTASLGVKVVEFDIWDGTKIEPADDSEGTAEDPILISTPEELAYVLYNGGGKDVHYKLTNDIYLNNPYLVNWSTGEAIASYKINAWKTNLITQGYFDGNNYSIYGLYLTDGKTSYIGGASAAHNTTGYASGLFGMIIAGGTLSVENLGVDYAYTRYDNCVSPFLGRTQAGSTANFEGCFVGENVTADGGVSGAFVALVDKNATVNVQNCYNLGTIKGKHKSGFMGYSSWNGGLKISFTNSYNATGKISDYIRTGDTAVNCYETTKSGFASGATVLTAEEMQGKDALKNMADLNSTGAYTLTKALGYPALVSFVPEDEIYVEGEENEEEKEEEEEVVETYEYWDGSKPYEVKSGSTIKNAESYAKLKAALSETGAGTEEDPYKITNGTDLYAVFAYGGEEGAYYQLQNDIYLNDLSKINWETGSVANGYVKNSWRPNVEFKGNVDGNGYTIYGLYYHDGKNSFGTSKTYACGLISKVGTSKVTVKDLGIDNCYFRYDSNAGAIIGSVYTTYEDGNIVGIGSAEVSGCYAGDNVTLVSNYAGLVGFVQDTPTSVSIDRCYSLANCNAKAGSGILGYSYWDAGATVTVSNSYNGTGKITGIARGNQTYTNCYEAVKGPVTSGVTTLTAENMTGSDALTSSIKMAGLKNASAFVTKEATFAQVNDFVVYLPMGTIFEEAYDVSFFDTRLSPLSAEDVLYKGKMFRGAFVHFNELPDLAKIQVPDSRVHQVAVNTAEYFFENNYFDIQTEVISQNLANQPDTTVNYLFITDLHFDSGDPVYTEEVKRQLQLVIDMANENEAIDFVCLGGDIYNGGFSSAHSYTYDVLDDNGNQTFDKNGKKITKTVTGAIESLQKFLAPINNCTKPVLILTGNHDDNAYSTDPATLTKYPYNYTFDGEVVYSAETALDAFKLKIVDSDKWSDGIIDQFVNRTLPDGTVVQVVQNEDVVEDNNDADDDFNSKYYYYDLEAKKTRVICLSASDFPYAYDENGNFEPVLKNSSETLLRSKYYCGYNFWGYGDEQVKWLAEEALTAGDDWNYIFLSHMGIENNVKGTQNYVNGKEVRKIINAYQNKTTYENADKNIAQVDFSATEGKILSYQFGHEHYDAAVYNASSDLWQFLTATINTSPDQSSNSNAQQVWSEKVGAVAVMSVAEGYVYKQDLGGFGETGMYYSTCKTVEGDVTLDTTVDIRDLVALRNLNAGKLVTAVMPTGDLAKMRDYILGK